MRQTRRFRHVIAATLLLHTGGAFAIAGNAGDMEHSGRLVGPRVLPSTRSGQQHAFLRHD